MTDMASQPDPHKYWKMKIKSMHMCREKKKAWVVGLWFYRPGELGNLDLRKKCI